MAELGTTSSLVGRAPGRGDPVPMFRPPPRVEGPKDWRAIFLPFSWGPGEGLGLEGGRRLMVSSEIVVRKIFVCSGAKTKSSGRYGGY